MTAATLGSKVTCVFVIPTKNNAHQQLIKCLDEQGRKKTFTLYLKIHSKVQICFPDYHLFACFCSVSKVSWLDRVNLPPLLSLSLGRINRRKQLDPALISSNYKAAEGNGIVVLWPNIQKNIIQLWRPNGDKYHFVIVMLWVIFMCCT